MEVRLDDIIVTKSGDSNGGSNCSRFGQNAALLVKDGAIATIDDARIVSVAKGGNGIFSYGGSPKGKGDGTRIDISNSKITTNGVNSGGISATGGGELNASSLTISTSGNSSSPITSNLGGGKIIVNEGTYSSSGVDSPAVYCMADMTLNQCSLISTASSGIVLRGKNSAKLTDCAIDCNDDTLTYPCMYKSGILIYDPDSEKGSAELKISGGSITNIKGHVIHLTNTKAKITLDDVLINNNDSEDVLLSVTNDGWGGSANDATVDIRNMKISGNIIVDSKPTSQGHEGSSLNLSISSNTTFTGSINSNVAEAHRGQVDLIVKQSCKFVLTETSYVTSLVNNGKIICGDYDLYVNGEKYDGGGSSHPTESELILNERTYIVKDKYGKLVVTQDPDTKAITALIKKSGQFTISGYGINTVIRVARNTSDVTLILDDLTIDDTRYARATATDSSVILLEPGASAEIILKGSSTLIGSDKYHKLPRAIIRGNESNILFTGLGSLMLRDSMETNTEFTDDNYPDGICNPRGELTFNSGKITTFTQGSGIRADRSVINFLGSEFNVEYSGQDSIRCDDGIINISDGRIDISESASNGITCYCKELTNRGMITIAGGYVRIYKVEGCGIRCENLDINDGEVDITPIYHQSAIAYYTTGNDIINKNTIYPVSNTEDKIRINVYCGYHHGIEVGKRAKTYSYLNVPKYDTEKKAGVVYTQPASGSINISGGKVRIDTRITGLITRVLYTDGYYPCSNDLYVIGSPGHGILSYGTVNISGGEVSIDAGGNGIECDETITVSKEAKIVISNAFVGLLGSSVIIGTSYYNPYVDINTTGENIVTIGRKFRYTYDDSRDEDSHYTIDTKSKTKENHFYLYGGKLVTDVDTTVLKSVVLRTGSPDSYLKKTFEYQPLGHSIKCFGFAYVQEGTLEIYGAYTFNEGYAPIDVTAGFMMENKATVLITGVDPEDKSIPHFGSVIFINPSDNVRCDNNTEFKVATGSEDVMYTNFLRNGGTFLLFAHPDFIYNAPYRATIAGETYILIARDALKESE